MSILKDKCWFRFRPSCCAFVQVQHFVFLWPPCVADADIIFLPCSFFFLLFLSSRNLSRRRLVVYHTFTHGVVLVRIQDAGLKRLNAARCKYRTQKIAKNLPSTHRRTNLIFTTKARIDNRKNLLNSNISSTCLRNMANFGPLTAEICWRVWGPQIISMGFPSWQRYCTALWQWASAKLCGVEQRAPSRWALAHILVFFWFSLDCLWSHSNGQAIIFCRMWLLCSSSFFFAENTGRKSDGKNRHLHAHHRTRLSGYNLRN